MNERLSVFYEKAINMIAGTPTLFELAKVVYEAFETPCIIVDAGYKTLAYSDVNKLREPRWLEMVDKGGADEDTIINSYVREGYMDSISKSGGALYIDWGICKDYPQTSGPVFVDETLQGFVSILLIEGESKEFAIELNTIVCRLCSIIMKSFDYRIKDAKNPIREFVAKKIFSDSDIDRKIKTELYKPYVDIEPPYIFISMSCDGAPNIILQHLKSRIDRVYSYIVYKMDEKNLYIFCHHIKAGREELVKDNVMKMIEDYRLKCGCSNIFTDLENRNDYFIQSKVALETALLVDAGGGLYRFNQNYVDIMLGHLAKNLPYNNAVPVEVRKLREYDEENESEYFDTIRTYLHNGNDINRTAEIMHLHRNTIVYRMTKALDIAGIDIHDYETLDRVRLGIQILDIKEKCNIGI